MEMVSDKACVLTAFELNAISKSCRKFDTKFFWLHIFVYFFHLVKGVIEAKRGCARNEKIENSDCRSFEVTLHNQGYPNAKAECFTCDSDGCNGAAQYGSIALFIALPVAIAKFFLF